MLSTPKSVICTECKAKSLNQVHQSTGRRNDPRLVAQSAHCLRQSVVQKCAEDVSLGKRKDKAFKAVGKVEP